MSVHQIGAKTTKDGLKEQLENCRQNAAAVILRGSVVAVLT
jgi:hypothetical protein